MDNQITISVQSLTINESLLRNCVAAFCATLDPTVDQINDIKTALSEAINNAIIHGYDGRPDCFVTVHASINKGTVYIEVKDNGIGISDINKARQPFFSTKPASERSGMGFVVMESYMDTLEITSDKNGTIVKMSKKLSTDFTSRKSESIDFTCRESEYTDVASSKDIISKNKSKKLCK